MSGWGIDLQLGNLLVAFLGDFAGWVAISALIIWIGWCARWVLKWIRAKKRPISKLVVGGALRVFVGLMILDVSSSLSTNAPKITLETDERDTRQRIESAVTGPQKTLTNQAPVPKTDDQRLDEMRVLDSETDKRTSANDPK